MQVEYRNDVLNRRIVKTVINAVPGEDINSLLCDTRAMRSDVSFHGPGGTLLEWALSRSIRMGIKHEIAAGCDQCVVRGVEKSCLSRATKWTRMRSHCGKIRIGMIGKMW